MAMAAIVRRPQLPPTAPALVDLLLLICFAQIPAFYVRADGSYSHTIPYGQEECLTIRVPKDYPHLISGSFDCLDTKVATDPIRVALYNSEEKRIWASPYGAAEGSFSEKGAGKHWLCLENGLTYEQQEREYKTHPRQRVTRTIGFSLRVRKSMLAAAGEDLGEGGEGGDVDGTMRRLLELADDLNENFMDLEDHMSFMKAREIVHRELHEETFTKVVRWNILEICTVVIVTFGQVLNVWWILSKRRSSYY